MSVLKFENSKTEVNICKICGTTCYYMDKCSSCQVKELITHGKQQSWEFGYIMTWGKRLYNFPVTQTITVLKAGLWIINPIKDQYSAHLKIKDGSKQIVNILYRNHITKEKAKKLINLVLNKRTISLNGKYWEEF